jgi:Rod binding domain-containing protein
MEGMLELQLNSAVETARSNAPVPTPTARTEEAARAAAEEFESFFLAQMLEQMFAQTEQDSEFGGGAGERAFSGLLHEEYANVMAQSGGLGLADRLTTEILRYQEAANQAASTFTDQLDQAPEGDAT